MANEASVQTSVQLSGTGFESAPGVNPTGLLDITAKKYNSQTASASTTESAIPKGNVTNPHLCVITNHDASATLYYRDASGADDGHEIPPGLFSQFFCKGTDPYIISDTGTPLYSVFMTDT